MINGSRMRSFGSCAHLNSLTQAVISFVFLCAVCIQSANAATCITATCVNYGDFLGTNVDYFGVVEDSTTDTVPLFGAPTLSGDSLLFFPSNYTSTANSGATDQTSSTLTMNIVAKGGTELTVITIQEFGDYSLSGVGTSATSASIDGALFVTDLSGVTGVHTDSLVVNPASPYVLPSDSSGIFSATTTLDLTGLGITEAFLTFNNNLATTSEAGTTALIQKKVVNGPSIVVSVDPIPVPAAVWLFGSGLLGLIGVARRKTV